MDLDGKQRSGSNPDETAEDSVYAVEGGERAPFRYRLAAMLYDTIIVAAIWVFTIVLLVTLTGDSVVGAWVQSLLFIELFVFFAFFWIHKGQTIGMLAWRLRLESEQPFTLRKAFFRFCGAMASFLTLGVGYYWIWFDPLRRSWPDIFSDSYIVRYSKETQSSEAS
ncbi:MAG: RDD family protein [Gammaproteobacteria bacterium]|nr:RDD family protein [Gammaproteobacteria bacterium]MYD80111.1 RDD family protein [Gammaproteobacteria bacterium]